MLDINDNVKVVVSGDSISKGVIYDESKNRYNVLKENYVNTISAKLSASIKNISRFGSTLAKGISNLEKHIGKESPDIVLIEYGGNDCAFDWEKVAENPDADHAPQTELQKFETALRETAERLKLIKITPILMTLPPLNAEKYLDWVSKNNAQVKSNIIKWLGNVSEIYLWQEKYSSVITQVAEETHTKFIDVRSAFLRHADFAQFICRDGMHPNKEGHDLMAEKVMDYLKLEYDHLLKPSC